MIQLQSELISKLQRRIAQVAISGQAIRNQGAAGVVNIAREELAKIDLAEVAALTPATFGEYLDKRTDGLLARFPNGAHESWGGARKAVNLFLRDVLYTGDLRDHFGLQHLRGLLEVPLDGDVANALLKEKPEAAGLPTWKTIKRLKPAESRAYQDAAIMVAARKGIARVDLDLYYWRQE